jgi:hypothetical protein
MANYFLDQDSTKEDCCVKLIRLIANIITDETQA